MVFAVFHARLEKTGLQQRIAPHHHGALAGHADLEQHIQVAVRAVHHLTIDQAVYLTGTVQLCPPGTVHHIGLARLEQWQTDLKPIRRC